MEFFRTITFIRVVFALGIVNLVTGVLLLFSCRCIPGMFWVGRLMKLGWFKRFYRYHCYIWWVFWGSVIVHVTLAILVRGFPF